MEKRPAPSLLDAVKAARGELEPGEVPVFLDRLAQIKKAQAAKTAPTHPPATGSDEEVEV